MSESNVIPIAMTVPTTASADPLLALIERAARDPSIDLPKLEKLLEMHERMTAQRARAAFNAAFAEMQPKMPTIGRKGEIKTNEKDENKKVVGQKKQSSYARWEDIDAAVRPIITAHGFSLSFRVSQTAERLTVRAVLSHRDGHSEETEVALPIDLSGSKNNVQGWGSSLSYGKRYATMAILNIISHGEDDDGKKAGAPETITEEQAMKLRDMLEATEAKIEVFCQYYKIDAVSELPAARFDHAMAALEGKLKR